MAINRTIIRVPSQDAAYDVPGDLSTAQIKQYYSATIQGLANMDATETVNGDVRTVTFTQRSGNKG